MTRQRQTVVGVAVVAILAIATLYISRERNNGGAVPPQFAEQHQTFGTVPSVASMIADPATLKSAAKECSEGNGPDVMTLCDHVHSAEAQLLAQKYRTEITH